MDGTQGRAELDDVGPDQALGQEPRAVAPGTIQAPAASPSTSSSSSTWELMHNNIIMAKFISSTYPSRDANLQEHKSVIIRLKISNLETKSVIFCATQIFLQDGKRDSTC